MKILVTGGAGFIGSHLVDKLQQDHEVTIIDNGVSGLYPNLFTFEYSHPVEIIRNDLSDCEHKTFKNFDVLFHLAAFPIRMNALFDYYHYFNYTERGTLSALEIARKNQIPTFVMAGSTSLYGRAFETGQTPTPETFIGSDPSFYGTSKFNSERWCEAYSGMFDMSVIITRFGRVLGPRCRNGSVWELVNRLKKNPKILEVLGDGYQCRSFVHVSDIVEGMLVALKNFNPHGVERFNIATSDVATVRDMIKIILEETGLNPEIHYDSSPIGWKGDNEIVQPDISKLRSFGWQPKFNSLETLRDCVHWTVKEVFK